MLDRFRVQFLCAWYHYKDAHLNTDVNIGQIVELLIHRWVFPSVYYLIRSRYIFIYSYSKSRRQVSCRHKHFASISTISHDMEVMTHGRSVSILWLTVAIHWNFRKSLLTIHCDIFRTPETTVSFRIIPSPKIFFWKTWQAGLFVP